MKKILFLIMLVALTGPIRSQVTLWSDLAKTGDKSASTDTLTFESASPLYIPESWDLNLDSMMHARQITYYTKRTEPRPDNPSGGICDSVYMKRLSKLPRVIELPYNGVIRNCIDLYVDRRRNLLEYMLGMADFYFPMIEQTLDKYGLPLELKYLAAVESALNPTALSRAGACGLWQFMLPTGKSYGLEINSLVDERRDPVKATNAACQYFKDMYAIYGDWNLVIAAYNCGPGNVNKAIKRAKGSKDYWEIYPFLPKETRMYVPFFIAANYAMNYYQEHGLYPAQSALPLSTDTVMINQQMHFDQIAEIMKIDKSQLRALNPQYKRDIIPGNTRPCPLLLPAIYAYGFVELEDTIARYKTEDFFANRTVVGKDVTTNQEKVTHKVTSGETLISIASKYGVTASNLKKWNGLKSNKVALGRRLTVYVDNGGYALAAKTGAKSETKAEAKTTAKVTQTPINNVSSQNKSAEASVSKSNPSYAKYKVKSGDTFFTIAKKYPGLDAKALMQLNDMKSSALKIGQYIKVPQV